MNITEITWHLELKRLSVIAFASMLIASCVGESGGREELASEVNYACGDQFRSYVEEMTKDIDVSCGVFKVNSSPEEKAKVIQCATETWSDIRSVSFGHEAIGDDSFFCVVAVRDDSKTLWLLYYDTDLSGGRGDEPYLSVQECESIAFTPGWMGENSFFNLNGCTARTEVTARLLRQDVIFSAA